MDKWLTQIDRDGYLRDRMWHEWLGGLRHAGVVVNMYFSPSVPSTSVGVDKVPTTFR